MFTRNVSASPLQRFIIGVFSLVMLVILLNILFSSDATAYAFKQIPLLPNWSLILCAVLLVAGMAAVAQKIKFPEWTHGRLLMILAAASVVLFSTQLVMIFQMYFHTGWDVRGIFKTVDALLQHVLAGNSDHYYPYSTYPNNLILTAVLYYIEKAALRLGLDGYLGCLVVSALSVNLSGFFTSMCTYRLTRKSSLTILVYVLFVILVGLSPWISIPYSDTYSILFPILALYLYLSRPEGKPFSVRCFWIGLCSVFGAMIKPTVLIVLIAIVLLEFLRLFSSKDRTVLAGRLGSLGLMAIAFVPMGMFSAYLRPHLNFTIDPQQQVGLTHYVMMGLNSESDGGYLQSDVDYSVSFTSVQERNQANARAILERVRRFGPVGLLEHASRKALANFADGSFAWSIEGSFYVKIPDRTGPLADTLRNWFYLDGANYSGFITIVQLLWFMVLILCAANGLDRAGQASDTGLVFLTVLGSCAFVMLFEARARYLFNFSPFFLTAAVLGFDSLVRYVTGRKGISA